MQWKNDQILLSWRAREKRERFARHVIMCWAFILGGATAIAIETLTEWLSK